LKTGLLFHHEMKFEKQEEQSVARSCESPSFESCITFLISSFWSSLFSTIIWLMMIKKVFLYRTSLQQENWITVRVTRDSRHFQRKLFKSNKRESLFPGFQFQSESLYEFSGEGSSFFVCSV
jgi:hypothetical protein